MFTRLTGKNLDEQLNSWNRSQVKDGLTREVKSTS